MSQELGTLPRTLRLTFIDGANQRKAAALLTHTPQSRWVLNEDNPILGIWTGIILFIVVFEGFYVPFILCFLETSYFWMEVVDYIITGLYAFDIILQFQVAYSEKGTLITSHLQIAKHYLKTWFLIDLCATIPFEMFISYPLLSLVPLSRLLKATRFLRFAKLTKFWKHLEGSVAHTPAIALLTCLKLATCTFLMAHICACLWFVTSKENLAPDSWVVRVLDASSYSITEAYIDSLYWSLTTMLTVGYGDYSATSRSEQIVSMLCMVSASACFGYIVGNVSSLLHSLHARNDNFWSTLREANQLLANYNIPVELRQRVRSYLNYIHELNQASSPSELEALRNLSAPLLEEILTYVNGRVLLASYPIGLLFEGSALKKLSLLLQEQSHAPGDILFQKGECSRTLYFLIEGHVELYLKQARCTLAVLSPLKSFGEIGFFYGLPRTCHAQLLDFAVCFTLDWSAVVKTFQGNQQISAIFEELAETSNLRLLALTCYFCGSDEHVACNCTSFQIKPHITLQMSKKNGQQVISVKKRPAAVNLIHKSRRFNVVGKHDYKC